MEKPANSKTNRAMRSESIRAKILIFVLGVFSAISGGAGAVDISTEPLYAGSRVPGNLALVPSVEFPTLISVANLQGTYTAATRFVGYFDSGKCYEYVYSAIESERHFSPVSVTTGHTCADTMQWSGNFLNWAATQTIDPFRSAMTGGYRVRDTVEETWVEKAIGDRVNTSNFPRRTITGATLVPNATPIQWGGTTRLRIDGLGNKMYFTRDGDVALGGIPGTTARVAYDPAIHTLGSVGNVNNSAVIPIPIPAPSAVYEVSVRVKVCDAAVGLEPNCVAYPSGYHKPEGLIQSYSNRIMYSIFGYQNVDGSGVDGGIMRARQKFVGPLSYYPELGPTLNTAREWNPETGVQYVNPDSADATATTTAVGQTIGNSGVINYLNKFGQMNTGKLVKSHDNVSELYYTAIRYFKNLGNVSEYSNLGGGTASQRFQRADAFPVITNWGDPIRYQCQTNVILGIGDTNTHYDKNLPGPTSPTNEPTKPTAVVSDTTVNVVDRMRQIWRKEGFSATDANTRASAASFNSGGTNNSGYIGALAYDAHTRDIRPTMPGRQTVSTHWVDVIEFGDYKSAHTNQYWLAAKYGGFDVPAGYDPDTNLDALDEAWWWKSGDMVPAATPYRRPDNYYVAADATKMVASLELAFRNIADAIVGSGGGFASNSTVLEAGAMTFQSRFSVNNGVWSGELQAYNVNPVDGSLSASWTATSQMPAWASRNIWVNSGGFQRFNDFTSLSSGHQTLLGSPSVMNYLRGERVNEMPGGPLRIRNGILGDIVNSEPVFVGAPNRSLYLGSSFTGASEYQQFAADQQGRRSMVYVGANDGMLHGFDASTGEEVFAFVPSAAIDGGLDEYAQPGFEHRYFVDGELTAADIYDTGTATWKTVLVGTMGRGGKAMFALDVTDPDDIEFLWELSDSDVSAIGNNLGKPIIGQVSDGRWRVFLGNGPNSTSDEAELVVVDVLDEDDVDVISTGVGGDNGLSGVNVWSSVMGGFSDTVYAGDFHGNLWRFNLATATATRLFQAERSGVVQPITSTPMVAKRPLPAGETWVFFGTGQYLNPADLSNDEVQSWYGIVDRGALVVRGDLQEVDILAEGAIGGVPVRGIEAASPVVGDGWVMDLVSPVGGQEGERMVVGNRFRGNVLIGTTRIPEADDPCSPSGRGWIMAIDPFSGGRLSHGFFDVDGDGNFDETVGSPPIPVSGIGMPSGPNNPIFIGNIMQVSLDDASSTSVSTNPVGNAPSRVSWRELLRN